jgi:hypothetical protein
MPERLVQRTLACRLLWLVVALGVGLAVSAAGYSFSGSQYWFLALPVALAAAWLFIGTPEQCMPKAGGGQGSSES